MPWNLLLLPLAGGYYIFTRCNVYKFKQQRLDKQRLIFESILIGIVILLITFLFRTLFFNFIPTLMDQIYSLSPLKSIPYSLTSLFSVVISVVYVKIINHFKDPDKCLYDSINEVGNEFEKLVCFSQEPENIKLLQFTLDNKKVYVGWVRELPIPSISTHIKIYPAYSGFRNDSLEINFTTEYLPIYSSYVYNGEATNIFDLGIEVVIEISNIVTVSNFDIAMYAKFQKIGGSK